MLESSTDHAHDEEARRVGLREDIRAPEDADIDAAVAEAERLVAESEQPGFDQLETAVRLSKLVGLYFSQRAFAKAVSPLLRLLALSRAEGEDRPEVATILASLATAYYALGDHDAAAQFWRRALDIRERLLAPNHFTIARNLEHLADACAAQGRFDEALALMKRAQEMLGHALSTADPTLAAMRVKIADLQLVASQERWGRGSARPRPGSSPRSSGLDVAEGGPYGGQGYGPRASRAGAGPRATPEPAIPSNPPPETPPEAVPPERPAPARMAAGEAGPSAGLTPDEELDAARAWASSPIGPPMLEPNSSPEGGHLPILLLPSDTDRASNDDGNRWPSEDSPLRRLRSLALVSFEALVALFAVAERARRERPRHVAAAGMAVAIVVLIFIWMYRHGAPAGPVDAAVAAATPVGPTRSAAAGALEIGVAPAGRGAPHGGVRQDDAADAASAPADAPGPTESAGAEPGTAESGSGEAAAGAASAAGLRQSAAALSSASGASIADALNGLNRVADSMRRDGDSAMRRILFGSVLADDPRRPDTSVRSAGAEPPREPAADRPVTTERAVFRPAALAEGSPMPAYPPALASAAVAGRVVIEVIVDADGRADPGSVRVLSSDDPLLTDAVLRTLREMRFVPAEAGGRKVPQRLQLPFTFTHGSTTR